MEQRPENNLFVDTKTFTDRERELRQRYLSRKERKERIDFKTSRTLRTLREILKASETDAIREGFPLRRFGMHTLAEFFYVPSVLSI